MTDSSVTEQFPEYAEYRERYKDFIFEKRLSMDDYILKTKESVMVFNTPSVGGCHGWKLAEYLCMGKAIISTPLSREMPGEGLIHGENIHFIASTEELEEAVAFIKTNVNYRKHLEQGARHYYEEYIAPDKVIKLFQTQKEALEYAKHLALTKEGTVMLHGLDGKIRKY